MIDCYTEMMFFPGRSIIADQRNEDYGFHIVIKEESEGPFIPSIKGQGPFPCRTFDKAGALLSETLKGR